jgi:conjugative transfer signal peptidase TraF
MIGRFDTSRVIKKAIRVALLLASAAVISTVAFCEFGLVFNFTHSAPFGIYRQAAEPTSATRKNSPYAFFCPDQRWPGLSNNPNTRRSLGTCPDGYAALLKPVVAWPGDVVTTTPDGVIVDGTPVPNSSPLTRDSLGRELHPYPYGTYKVAQGQIWVVSSYSSRSFDSRYFGPVPLRTVREWVRPFITERYKVR